MERSTMHSALGNLPAARARLQALVDRVARCEERLREADAELGDDTRGGLERELVRMRELLEMARERARG